MIDLAVARRAGRLVLGAQPPIGLPAGDLPALADDADTRVRAYTGMEALAPLPPPEWVGREAWLEANLVSMGRMLAPLTDQLEERVGRLPAPLAAGARAAAGAVVGAELGGLAGWMGRRVLGQYDLALLDGAVTPRLLLVAPNLHEAAGQLAASEADLLTWVCVHETTHAVQFGSVPWLREHLAGLLGDLLAARGIDTADLPTLVRRVRSRGVAGLMGEEGGAGPFDALQATMAVIEGHAEHVMDVVGAELLPALPELRRALDARRARRRSPVALLLERLLGMELKLRQYQEGKAFCDAVVASAGVEALHRVFSAPAALPSLAELRAPEAWVARVVA